MDIDCHYCPIGCFIKEKLTDNEVDLLNNNHAFVSYKAKENIFKTGLPVNYLKILLTGKVKLFYEGKTRSIFKLEKGQKLLFGPGFSSSKIHQYSASAITNADICFINIDTIEFFLNQNPQFSLSYLKKFSQVFNEFQNSLKTACFENPRLRLANALLYLSEKIYESANFEIEFSKKEFLEYIGISSESYNKEIKWLEKLKLISYHNKIFKLKNIPKLKKLLQ